MKKCIGILLGAILILTLSAADKAPAKVQFKAALKGKKQIFSPGEKADRWIFSEISEALMTAGANE